MCEFTIKAEPFSWNENLSEVAIEDFDMIRSGLGYCTSQSIGMALAKLKMMEDKGLNPDTLEKIVEHLEEYMEEAEHYGFASAISDIIAFIKEGLE